jgi:serine protease Do
MAVLEEITTSIEGLVERVGPAVVGLGRGWGRGSGVVTAHGRVLTNAHNLRGDTVTVTFGDGRRETGTVAGVDLDADVAVVSVDTGDVEAVEWAATGDAVGIGRAVFALANPGGRGLRATFGLVSAAGRSFRGPRGRRIRGSIEHTAPLPRGSSGGPLVDADGRLLGLNTMRMDGGLILAIAADESLRDRADALARGETAEPTRLGVAIAPSRVARRLQRAVGLPERDGLLVHAVEDGSPAERAGIEKGDLIVAAGDREVARLDDLHQALDAVRGGGELELTLVRGTEERKASVSFSVVV